MNAHPVDQKPCTKCGEWKRVPEDYSMRRRKLADGTTRSYPAPECKACARERAEQWKRDFIAEHGEEAWKAKSRAWNAKRDQEKRRRYDRDYQRMVRAEAGTPKRGPWLKYRNEAPGATEQIVRVDAGPFREWWKSLAPLTKARVYAADVHAQRTILRIFNEQDRMEYSKVEDLCALAGYPGVERDLYPSVSEA